MDQSGNSQVASVDAPPAEVRRIGSEAEAGELAHRLLMLGRRWPVAVLTIPAGYDEPFGDPQEIKEAVGDLAEVVLMPTSDVSLAFAQVMPPTTQVYGGAGRVYPVDHGWVLDPRRSKLRFAYSLQDRKRITEQLINDALEAALAAGLVEQHTTPGVRQRSGQVQGVIGSRALVTLDDMSMATVWEELTIPGVALDRVLLKGQSVAGSYDSISRRLDLRSAPRFTDATSARAAVDEAYQIGDVVLADVAAVTDDAVTARLLPGLAVEVGRDAVTANPHDLLGGLFSVGEIVACRIVAVEPLRLRFDDIDDEEVPKPAPSLLPGGPPWLRLPEPQPQPPTAIAVHPALAPPTLPVVPSVVPRQPTPLDLARRSRAPLPGPAAAQPVNAIPLEEQARIVHLTNELAAERATREALARELAGLRAQAATLEAAPRLPRSPPVGAGTLRTPTSEAAAGDEGSTASLVRPALIMPTRNATESTLEPVLRFESDEALTISYAEYVRASAFGAEQLCGSPGAGYVITLASLLGWSASLGDELGGQQDGFPMSRSAGSGGTCTGRSTSTARSSTCWSRPAGTPLRPDSSSTVH